MNVGDIFHSKTFLTVTIGSIIKCVKSLMMDRIRFVSPLVLACFRLNANKFLVIHKL